MQDLIDRRPVHPSMVSTPTVKISPTHDIVESAPTRGEEPYFAGNWAAELHPASTACPTMSWRSRRRPLGRDARGPGGQNRPDVHTIHPAYPDLRPGPLERFNKSRELATMGIFDRLFGKPDPTRDWIADPTLLLKLDLDDHSLAGIRIGDPIDRIARLGPTEDPKSIKYDVYEYGSKGFRVGFSRGLVNSFEVVFGQTIGAEGYSPFVGVCHHRGSPVALGPTTTVGDFVTRFGNPYWRDVEERESLLFYEFAGDVEWQVEFDTLAQLRFFQIVTPPLLADATHRSSYGVDRSWPPSIRA